MTDDIKDAGEVRNGLKLLGRALAIIGLASLLWHVPIGIDVFRWILTAVALVLLFFAGIGLLVSAAAWRNILWRATLGRTSEWRGGKTGSVLLAVPALLILALMAAFVFLAIGRLLQ